MSKIAYKAFIENADQIAEEKPSYKLGHDGSDGKCDCVGYIIGSIRRSGGTWNGVHGSNYSSRNEMEYLESIVKTSDLKTGEVVYKVAEPGESNYNLPSRYEDHVDQKDYYHIGIVRSVDPLRIVHCTGPGIVTDTKLGKWNYHGWLKKVAKEGEIQMPEQSVATKKAVVVAENGNNVNLRKTPNGKLVERIPVGAAVVVNNEENGWSNISYGNVSGWMMSSFLHVEGENSPSGTNESSGEKVNIALPRELAEQLRDALASVIGWG